MLAKKRTRTEDVSTMRTCDLPSAKLVGAMRLEMNMSQYEPLAREKSQQALEGEDADGRASASTISPTSLESEAAFPPAGNFWHDGWKNPSAYNPVELPKYDIRAQVPGSHAERGRPVALSEVIHHQPIAIKGDNLVVAAEAFGTERRPSWEEIWNHEYDAAGFVPTSALINVPFGPVVARSTEMGYPEVVVRESPPVLPQKSRPEVPPRRRADTRLPVEESSQNRRAEAPGTFDQFEQSIIPERRLAHGLLALSRAQELNKGLLDPYQTKQSSSARACRYDFEFDALVAVGRIPRARIVDFPISNIRTALWDKEVTLRGGIRGRNISDEGKMGKEADTGSSLGNEGQDNHDKRRRVDAESMQDPEGNDLQEIHPPPPPPGHPFAPLTSHDWL